MARPKGKLIALLAVFAAIGLVAASGAFTSVSAERTADVQVSDDANALLAISDATSGATAQTGDDYFSTNNGEAELQFQNINLNAGTEVDSVFTVTNQGSQTVTVWITKTGANSGAVAFGVDSNKLDSASADISSDITDQDRTSIAGTDLSSATAVALDPGESMTIGLYIDTTDGVPTDGLGASSSLSLSGGDGLLSSITINADADASEDTTFTP